MPVHDFVRAFLACYFTFVAVAYAAKLIGANRRTGVVYADAGPRGTTQYVAHQVFHVFRLTIWGACVLRLAFPGLDPYFVPLPGFEVAALEAAGVAVMAASLFVTLMVHAYMDADWRSGVPQAGPTALLTEGPFAVVRHPGLSAVVLGQIGFLMAFPTLFALICLIIGATVVLRQAHFEEEAMMRRFGEAYVAYAARIPAWPGGARGVLVDQGFPTATGQSSRPPHSAQDPS